MIIPKHSLSKKNIEAIENKLKTMNKDNITQEFRNYIDYEFQVYAYLKSLLELKDSK